MGNNEIIYENESSYSEDENRCQIPLFNDIGVLE